jgi:hypothetical protein
MPTTDAVAIFAEGTFEDQVRMCLDVPSVALRANVLQIAELAGYISQSRPEPERAPYISNQFDKGSPSRRASLPNLRVSSDEDRCSLPCLETSRV